MKIRITMRDRVIHEHTDGKLSFERAWFNIVESFASRRPILIDGDLGVTIINVENVLLVEVIK